MLNSLEMPVADLTAKTISKDGSISTTVTFVTHLNPVAIGALARLQEIGYLSCEIGTGQSTMFDGSKEQAPGPTTGAAEALIKQLESEGKTSINNNGEKMDISDAEFKEDGPTPPPDPPDQSKRSSNKRKGGDQ